MKPWTLRTVHAQDNTKGNCVLLIAGDVDLYLVRYVEVFSIFTGSHFSLFPYVS